MRATSSLYPNSLVTSTGVIHGVAGELSLVPAQEGLAHLAGLHGAAIGSNTGYGGFSGEQAFLAYSNLDVSLLGQIAFVDAPGAALLLREMTDFASQNGLSGIEGAYVSALRSCQDDPRFTAEFERAVEVMAQAGAPDQLGGGAQSTVAIDAATGRVTFPDDERLRAAFSSFSGGPASAAQALDNLFAPDPSAGGGLGEASDDDYVTAGKAIGGTVGAVGGGAYGFFVGIPTGPGAVVSGWGGALLGGAAGAAVGGALGKGAGWVVSQFKPDTPASETEPAPTRNRKPHTTPSSTTSTAPATTTSTSSSSTSSGSSGTSAPHSTRSTAPRCVMPDGDTGFHDEFLGDGSIQSHTVMPSGPGLDALVTSHAGGIGLIALPAYDGEAGVVDLGYMVGVPELAALLTGGTGDDRHIKYLGSDGETGGIDPTTGAAINPVAVHARIKRWITIPKSEWGSQ